MSFTTVRLAKASFVFLATLICWHFNMCHKLRIIKPPTVNYREFHQLLKSEKPLIAEFGRKWFTPSMKVRDALTRFWLKHKDEVNVCFVEVFRNEKLVNEFEVDFVPTIVVFNSKGEEIFRYVGQWGEEDVTKAAITLGLVKKVRRDKWK